MLLGCRSRDDGNENGAREGRRPSSWLKLDQAALVLRWPNMMCLASSSISALKVNLSFSAIARGAAGLAETSSSSRFTFGYFVKTSSPSTYGAIRAQPQNAISTIV